MHEIHRDCEALARKMTAEYKAARPGQPFADIPGEPLKQTSDSRKRRSRLSVGLKPPQAVLDGQAHALNENAAIYLKALLDADGHVRSGPEIAQQFPIFPADKVTRVRKSLPKILSALVETKQSGSYLKPEAWLT
jgi:hypothetical protein